MVKLTMIAIHNIKKIILSRSFKLEHILIEAALITIIPKNLQMMPKAKYLWNQRLRKEPVKHRM